MSGVGRALRSGTARAMRTHRCRLALILALVVSFAHADTTADAARKRVLDEVLTLSQRHAFNATRVDWPRIARESSAMLERDNTEAGLTAAIRHALAALKDRHSSYRPPRALI